MQTQFSLFEPSGNILPQDGEALMFPHFFSEEENERYLQTLLKETSWRQDPIVLYGKEIMQPRLTAWYGDKLKPLSYSGITMPPVEWTSTLLEIKAKVEDAIQFSFTSVLLNYYRNEQDSVGWHRDNEKKWGPNPTIASVSFGATRTFQFRHYFNKSLKTAVDLTPGSLLLMRAETQHFWEHQIPKRKHAIGPRINLTFRRV